MDMSRVSHCSSVFILLGVIAAGFQSLRAQLPPAFDLRDVNGRSYVTAIKSQQGGTCWTHGTMAAIESNLLMTRAWEYHGETDEPDLAEYHLDWWNGFNQFYNGDLNPPTGNGLIVHEGGDYRVAAAYLSCGEGAVRDIDGQSFNSPPLRYSPSYHRYYVRDIEWFIAGLAFANFPVIKQRLMQHGALGTCLFSDNTFYENNCHYQPLRDTNDPNHAVAIIGWDDAKITQHYNPGAWLVKNSWGSGWGNNGCFWISYYDKHAVKHPEMGAVSFFNVVPMFYHHIYYHDYHGWRATLENTPEVFNAFTALERENLIAVSFYTTTDSVTYTVQIYGQYSGGQLLQPLSTQSGLIVHHGFHTLDLGHPVELPAGAPFYVYLSLSDGCQAFDRTSEVPVLLGASYRGTIVASSALPNQSFYRQNSQWKDLYYLNLTPWPNHTANFCVKALTIDTLCTASVPERRYHLPGETLPLPLTVRNFIGVAELQLALRFNPQAVTFSGLDSVFGGLDLSASVTDSLLTISCNNAAAATINIGQQLLCNLLFTCHDGHSTVRFDTGNCIVRRADNSLLNVSYGDGAIWYDPSEPALELVHHTGDLSIAVWNEGSLATNGRTIKGSGIHWKGQSGAYSGGILFGNSARGQTNGLLGGFGSLYPGLVTDIRNLDGDFYSGFSSNPDFDQITTTLYCDADAAQPYHVNIIQHSYTQSGQPFGIIRYGFINTTGDTIHDFYAGIFMDWDIGDDYRRNFGGYDTEHQLVYQYGYDAPTCFGIAALNGLAGMKISEQRSSLGSETNIRQKSFEWISTPDPQPIVTDFDLRSWVGSRVGDLPPADTIWCSFAIVAGDNLLQIQQHTSAAFQKAGQQGWSDIVTGVDPRLVRQPERYALHPNYPNPFNSTTTISYQLPAAQQVRITVFNLRGEQVAQVVNQFQSPGRYVIPWQAGNLGSGVYFIRLEAGSFCQVQRCLLLK